MCVCVSGVTYNPGKPGHLESFPISLRPAVYSLISQTPAFQISAWCSHLKAWPSFTPPHHQQGVDKSDNDANRLLVSIRTEQLVVKQLPLCWWP